MLNASFIDFGFKRLGEIFETLFEVFMEKSQFEEPNSANIYL